MTGKNVIKEAEADLDGDQIITIKLARKDGDTKLFLKSTEEFEELFQSDNTLTPESDSWESLEEEQLEFYKKSSIPDSVARVFNDHGDSGYGGRFYKNRYGGNPAPLRSVGISEGVWINIDEPYAEKNLKKIQEDLKEAAEALIDQFLSDVAFMSEVREIKAQTKQKTG